MNKPVTLQIDDKEIIFIGTAHVSKASAEEVKECIELYQPDCVCIELDEDRYETLQQPNKWKNTDILQYAFLNLSIIYSRLLLRYMFFYSVKYF